MHTPVIYEEGSEMLALIRYPVGVIVEAVILAVRRNRLRVAAAGFPDAFELRRSGNRWLTDTGDAVEFEFLSARAEAGEEASASKRVLAARFAGAQVV
jgi:hypothetical protein